VECKRSKRLRHAEAEAHPGHLILEGDLRTDGRAPPERGERLGQWTPREEDAHACVGREDLDCEPDLAAQRHRLLQPTAKCTAVDLDLGCHRSLLACSAIASATLTAPTPSGISTSTTPTRAATAAAVSRWRSSWSGSVRYERKRLARIGRASSSGRTSRAAAWWSRRRKYMRSSGSGPHAVAISMYVFGSSRAASARGRVAAGTRASSAGSAAVKLGPE